MAESDNGWWDSWYKAAKDKSVEVLQFVKRDLDEFSTVVKSEASNVVNTTTTAIKDKLRLDEPESTASNMKRSVSSFLGSVGSVLSPVPDDEDQEALVIHDSQPVQMTRLQAKLHCLTLDPETFLRDPDPSLTRQYEGWLEILEDQLTADRLSRLLASSPELNSQYTRLVPDQVSHMLFWQRFLFRKALTEDEEARKEILERRAEREKQAAENFQWDKEENLANHIELSEEEQIQLLAEYEKECEDKRLYGEDHRLSTDHYSEELPKSKSEPALKIRVREKRDLVIVGDGSSCHTSSCSGDKESNDDDWEREFDLDEGEADPTTVEVEEQKGPQ